MNKISMSGKVLNINDENIELQNDSKVIVSGKSKITIFNNYLSNLIIEVKDKSEVLIEDFRIIAEENTNIKLIMGSNGKLTYNHSFINKKEYNLDILTEYQENNSKIIIKIHGINDNGSANIKIDGVLGKNINNELYENIRIINENNSKATIIPNILVDCKEVVANHATTIGKINENELNYLMSKGIEAKSARKLILNGFIVNTFDSPDLITKIKEIINWR